MSNDNPEARPGIFRETTERFRTGLSGLESNLLETSHSFSKKIRGLLHEGRIGPIGYSRLVWIGAVATVWMGSGYTFFKISHIVTQEEPATSAIKLWSSVAVSFIVTSAADHLLLRKIKNI